jgi:hypothetical protein
MSEMDEVLGGEDVQLDESQKEAIRHVLSHRVAVIQVGEGDERDERQMRERCERDEGEIRGLRA